MTNCPHLPSYRESYPTIANMRCRSASQKKTQRRVNIHKPESKTICQSLGKWKAVWTDNQMLFIIIQGCLESGDSECIWNSRFLIILLHVSFSFGLIWVAAIWTYAWASLFTTNEVIEKWCKLTGSSRTGNGFVQIISSLARLQHLIRKCYELKEKQMKVGRKHQISMRQVASWITNFPPDPT